MTTKDELHQVIETLGDDDAAELLLYARALNDPVLMAALRAPYDDEPETDEERGAVAQGEADIAAGRVSPDAEIRREFGL